MRCMQYKKDISGETEVYFEKSFFRGEFRCDFFVSSEMKRAWAEQIEILAEVDRICKKHDISYFADGGTLLGAIRHQGYIPWDDDLDIAMLRCDYDRFLRVCQKELKDEYELYLPFENKKFDQTFIRVVNDRGLKKCGRNYGWCHGFKYFAGVDVFPLDYIAKDIDEFELQKELTKCVDYARRQVRMGVSKEVINPVLNKIEELCHKLFDREHDLEKQLGKLFEEICTLYREEESEEVTLFLWVNDHPDYHFKKEWYADSILVKFENVMLPCPVGYKEVLKKAYGNYMVYEKGTASHDYPFYGKYQKAYEKEYSKALCLEVKRVFAGIMDIDICDITDADIVKLGIRNQMVRINTIKNKYIMRIVRAENNHMLSRDIEKIIYDVLSPYQITDPLYMYDANNGNKISAFIPGTKKCNILDWEEISMCFSVLKFVHNLEIDIQYSFDLWERIEFYENIREDASYFDNYLEIKEYAKIMYEYTLKQEKCWGITQFEVSPDNFLIFQNAGGQTDIRIIDWEYAGMQDTHLDIAMFAIAADYSREELDILIDLYFGDACKKEIRLKIYCYMALGALFYSNYYEYFDRIGYEMKKDTLRFYPYIEEYYCIFQAELQKMEEMPIN